MWLLGQKLDRLQLPTVAEARNTLAEKKKDLEGLNTRKRKGRDIPDPETSRSELS